MISPWNEINHFTQPTSRDPRAAAKFTDKCRQAVPGLHDRRGRRARPGRRPRGQDARSSRRPRSTSSASASALKAPRTICGIHNYSDVNRFRSTGTKALMKALGCKQYWLTETGGLYKFGSFWSKKT